MNHSTFLLRSSLSVLLLLPSLAACGGDDLSAGTGGNGGAAGQGAGGAAGSSGPGGASGTAGNSGTAGTDGGCEIGKFQCSDNILQVCAKTTRTFEAVKTCGAGLCDAQAGNCKSTCTEGAFHCDGDNLQKCENGAFKFSQSCGKNLCSETSKACLTCVPNEAKACNKEQTAQLLCDSSGEPTVEKACPAPTKFCVGDGVCGECRDSGDCEKSAEPCYETVCTEQHKCIAKPIGENQLAQDNVPDSCILRTCDGAGKVTSTNREANTSCKKGDQAGFCNQKGVCGECKSGDKSCSNNTDSRSCSEDGNWEPLSSCNALPQPLCGGAGECYGIVQMGAGDQHTCALDSLGRVYCWGSNSAGQLGLGNDKVGNVSDRPQLVPGLPEIKQLAVGFLHTCALGKDGKAYCWGDNSSGQVGKQSLGPVVALPASIGTVSFSTISLGERATCAIASGALYCWGKAPFNGRAEDVLDGPVIFSLPSNLEQVGMGREHGCAYTKSGDLFCWGNNYDNQVGLTSGTSFSSIQKVQSGMASQCNGGAMTLSVGDYHNYLWSPVADCNYYIWGRNNYSQLNKTAEPFSASAKIAPPKMFDVHEGFSPKPVGMGYGATGFVFGGEFFLVGRNDDGRLGSPANVTSTIKVTQIPTPDGIALGNGHTCAWKTNGRAWCWGTNKSGQLGIGGTENQLIPTQVKW